MGVPVKNYNMKKILVSISLVFASLLGTADEGMWLLQYLADRNYEDMKAHGLNLTADEIYSINNNCLKDAIVSFGGFCTGEMISSEGLLLTNHHCGFDAIQANSTVEHDYLTDGFWAMTRGEEIPIEGLFVRFMVKMEDVTKAALEGTTTDMDPAERDAIIQENIDAIYSDADDNNGRYEIEIESFYKGNEYYMFYFETFEDIRMVGAPPSSIGKFGGDTDNWMWPRHTGDFSLFRVYADADGNPAAYSPDNVVYQPKHHLPVSLNGVEPGDYAMILGFPGSTDRYLSSFGVQDAINVEQPERVLVRGVVLDIMKEYMDADPAVRIQYASKYAQIANYWKYFIGQSAQLEKNGVYQRKVDLENAFQEWADSDPERKKIYGNVVSNIGAAYDALNVYTIPSVYFEEAVFNMELNFLMLEAGPIRNMVLFGSDFDAAAITNSKESIGEAADEFFKNYHAPIDKQLYATLLDMYFNNVPVEYHPEVMTEINKKYKGDFQKFVDKTWDKSFLTSKERLMSFVENPDEKAFDNDYYIKLLNGFITIYFQFANEAAMASNQLENSKRLFIEGLRLMYPDQHFAPDANSTLRLTYGNVMEYEPMDGVTYNFVTSLDGVIAKKMIETDADGNVDKNHEFYVHDRLMELYKTKDYGQYEYNGSVPVCFIANLDITGGNSGSPVINGDGHLIGCAFDGNWEAMSGDIAFENELQRTICVDARYILFIIDKYAGATHLIDEMDIVIGEPEEEEVRIPVEDVQH